MIDEVNKVIREELVTDRDSQRHKRYQRHLLGSIDVVVSANRSNFPLKIKVTSKAEKRKVAALEYGSPGHLITPKNGEWLYFPYNPGGNAHANAYQARRAPGSPKIGPRGGTKSKAFLAKTYTVEHPGNRPYHFMRRGVERVIQRRLR